jgi:hypothetical protein
MLSVRFDNISVIIVEYKEFAEKTDPPKIERHLHLYFSNIVVVSFIVGGNRRTRRKTPTCKPRPNIIDFAIEKVLLQY